MRLVDAWPRDSRRDRAMFEKLKDAYVKARHSKHYRISDEELTGNRVARSEVFSIVRCDRLIPKSGMSN